MLKTNTKINAENKTFYSNVIEKAAAWLQLETVDVTLVKTSEISDLGECSPEGRILVANGRDRDVVAHTMIHEMVHAEQFQNYILEEINGDLYFWDEKLLGNAHCQEADRVAENLLKQIKAGLL